MYLYRAVGKVGNTLDFILSERSNRPAATRFFAKVLSSNGLPNKIAIDKSSANAAGIREPNRILKRFGCSGKVQTIKSKYLNNMIEKGTDSLNDTCGKCAGSSRSDLPRLLWAALT